MVTLGHARYHCNHHDFHLNDKGVTLFTENILSALNKIE